MKIIAIIPARYGSSRFPGKPLAILGGKYVIQRVYEQVSSVLDDVFVATDDQRIYNAVEEFGGSAIMTSPDHRSGTDRIVEAYDKCGVTADVVINVQGDEPFIQPKQLHTLISCFEDVGTQIATLGKYFDDMSAVTNPNSPKIVMSDTGFALYFSRSVIPFVRGVEQSEWTSHFPFVKHLGVYAYRTDTLHAITRLPMSPLERAESLEQLRWLQAGYRIRVGITEFETIGIDTPADLERAEQFLSTI